MSMVKTCNKFCLFVPLPYQINHKSKKINIMKQVLYIDYSGGKFETWFYSEGKRYAGKNSFDYEEILRYKRKNDFTDMILTDEAKQRNRK